MSPSAATSRWLVTGAGGMLGTDAGRRPCAPPGARSSGSTRAELDITDPAAVDGRPGRAGAARRRQLRRLDRRRRRRVATRPTPLARQRHGPGGLPRRGVRGRSGRVLLHVSTDYVFAGDAHRALRRGRPDRAAHGVRPHQAASARSRPCASCCPTAATSCAPRGSTAPHGGELRRHDDPAGGRARHPRRRRRPARASRPGPATLAAQLARARRGGAAPGTAPAGIYHATARGETTWYGLAREVFALLGPTPSGSARRPRDAFARPAPRPAYSVLGHDGWARAGLAPMRPWHEACARSGRPASRSLRQHEPVPELAHVLHEVVLGHDPRVAVLAARRRTEAVRR